MNGRASARIRWRREVARRSSPSESRAGISGSEHVAAGHELAPANWRDTLDLADFEW